MTRPRKAAPKVDPTAAVIGLEIDLEDALAAFTDKPGLDTAAVVQGVQRAREEALRVARSEIRLVHGAGRDG